jgi:hypothetical protein
MKEITTMEINEKYFEILYNIIRDQNKKFLKLISENEQLNYRDLLINTLPKKNELKEFLREYK